MAQQTQVARVDDAWADFLERFPTPHRLAQASSADGLRAWAGLGYNRRAIHLQRAARVIVAEHAGRVPDSVADLECLPGVGPYTARAVAALAYGRPVAAVDTNVRRVISRLHGRVLGARDVQEAAQALMPPDDAAIWNHAVMELGATVCRARRPDCPACPVRRWCQSAGRVGTTSAQRQSAAGSLPPDASPGPGPVPFERTSRWLRGRIVARLRDVEEGTWSRLPGSIGVHGTEAVTRAVAALQRDGLVERHADGSVRLPSGPT